MAKTTSRERVALFTPAFLEDLRWWVKTDRKVALRVLDLLDAVLRDPFERAQEARAAQAPRLRYLVPEHRLVDSVGAERIDFLQARYHY